MIDVKYWYADTLGDGYDNRSANTFACSEAEFKNQRVNFYGLEGKKQQNTQINLLVHIKPNSYNGTLTVELTDGKTVKAKRVSYAGGDIRVTTVEDGQMNISPRNIKTVTENLEE